MNDDDTRGASKKRDGMMLSVHKLWNSQSHSISLDLALQANQTLCGSAKCHHLIDPLDRLVLPSLRRR